MKIKNEEVDVEKILDRDRFVKTLKHPLGITHIKPNLILETKPKCDKKKLFLLCFVLFTVYTIKFWKKTNETFSNGPNLLTVTDSTISDDYDG